MKDYTFCPRWSAKSYVIAQIYKRHRAGTLPLLVVPSLRHLDNMIALGVQPSQLRLMSEIRQAKRQIVSVIDETKGERGERSNENI